MGVQLTEVTIDDYTNAMYLFHGTTSRTFEGVGCRRSSGHAKVQFREVAVEIAAAVVVPPVNACGFPIFLARGLDKACSGLIETAVSSSEEHRSENI